MFARAKDGIACSFCGVLPKWNKTISVTGESSAWAYRHRVSELPATLPMTADAADTALAAGEAL